MFDSLKKKLSDAIKSFSEKEITESGESKEESSENLENAEKDNDLEESEIEDKITEQNLDKKSGLNNNLNKNNIEANESEKTKVKISKSTKIKSVFSGKIKLSDSDIYNFLENIRMILLQSDVSFDTTEKLMELLDKELHEGKFNKKDLSDELINSVRNSIGDVIDKKSFNLFDYINEQLKLNNKPFKIMFLGFNGTGKTTTIAKIAYNLKNNGRGVVLSASDTFRAAAIEQLDYHAKKIGVPIIKGTYGADPASIAFDSIAYAKSHSIDVVLIDTSGRQETNKNLMGELEKISRISKPDLTIFVGESISGGDLSERIKEFSQHLKIDGVILTKLDCDVKGGSAISISMETGIPIYMFGTGEGYSDFINYDSSYILKSLIP